MSNAKQDTIADIVAKMLEFADTDSQTIGRDVLRRRIQDFVASIIEAAAKREREATCEKSSQVGNAAAMRKALSDACYAMFNFLKTQNGGYEEMAKALDKAKAALASPPRNCDIGTLEEQSERFDAHCRKHMGCLTCPLREKDGGVPKHCEFAWSQMPYEEGGVK